MSLQGLFGCRNLIVSIETEWQAALCFSHGCFPNLGPHLYFTQSPNANSLSGLTPFKLTPSTWEITLHLQLTPYVVIVTIHGNYGSLWYLSLLVPIDQFSLNVFSIANALAFTLFLIKSPLHLVFGPNKSFGINFWV